MLGDKAPTDQSVQEGPAAKQVACGPAAHAARRAPVHRQRSAALRIAAVVEDANPDVPDARGLAVAVQVQKTPADGIGADVDDETLGHGALPIAYGCK